MIFGEHTVPQSEVIRAILLEDGPCCGIPHPVPVPEREAAADVDIPCHHLASADNSILLQSFLSLLVGVPTGERGVGHLNDRATISDGNCHLLQLERHKTGAALGWVGVGAASEVGEDPVVL